MPLVLLKVILGEVLANEKTKKALMHELRELTKSTENDLDDEAVDVFEKVYDTVVSLFAAEIK